MPPSGHDEQLPIPRLLTSYRRIFVPEGGIYQGRPYTELTPGEYYDQWVPNDHCFARDRNGSWHIFGITHPLTSCKNVHDGEEQLFHAVSSGDLLSANGSCQDHGTILPPETRPGEPAEIHSPFIIEKDGTYRMVYGPKSFRVAQSDDLEHWSLCGELFSDPDGYSRDPQILFHENQWMICYCSGNEIRSRTSRDFKNWSTHRVLLTIPGTLSPESPFLFIRDGIYYLAICLWDGISNYRQISSLYQHRTLLFAARTLAELSTAPVYCELSAHAPEFIQHDGRWFISSAEYPTRGINIAELTWD